MVDVGMVVVVKLEGSPLLCKTDEVGELCLSSGCCGTSYWGLPGVSSSVFKACWICIVFHITNVSWSLIVYRLCFYFYGVLFSVAHSLPPALHDNSLSWNTFIQKLNTYLFRQQWTSSSAAVTIHDFGTTIQVSRFTSVKLPLDWCVIF